MPTVEPTTDWAEDRGPVIAVDPSMVAIDIASDAVDCKAPYTSFGNIGFVLLSAECSKSVPSFGFDSESGDSMGDALRLRALFGDVDMVVLVVVAVGGLFSVALLTAADDVGGILPVSSSLCIRDLRLSNSSQTVEGAVVDAVELVPSSIRGVSPPMTI